MAVTGAIVDFVFDRLVEAAAAGRRCPDAVALGSALAKAGLSHGPGSSVPDLARAGKIQIEISGKNFRVVEIAVGPHKGRRTAENPSGSKPHLIIRPGGRHEYPMKWGER